MKKRTLAPKYGRKTSVLPVKHGSHFCNGFVRKPSKRIMRS